MKHKPRRRAALAAATSVIVFGGMALAVPALAASANKSRQSASITSSSAKAKKPGKHRAAPVSPTPTSTTAPKPGAPDFDRDGQHRPGGPGHGPGGRFAPYSDLTSVLADLVTKGTLTAGDSAAVTSALDAAEAAEHQGQSMPDGWHGTSQLPSVLADLVTKGNLSQTQVDAIKAGLDAKRDAAQAAEEAFRSQADGIVAGVLGITVEQLQQNRQNHVKPNLTQAQRDEIKTKLDALRTSMGLPTRPDGPGMGMGPGMGHGHHGFGERDHGRVGDGNFGRGGRGGFGQPPAPQGSSSSSTNG